jgi:DNA-binding beta-propeller fold protein YncE
VPILSLLVSLLAAVAAADSGVVAPVDPSVLVMPSAPAAADSLPLRLVRTAVVVSGGGPDQRLIEPAGIAADAFGRIVVSDASLHRLQRYDARGAWLDGAGTLGSDPGQFRRPGSVAALGNFGVAVLDRENKRVVSYDLHGRLLGTLIDLTDPALLDQLGYIDPVAMTADRGGAVYVADADHDRLLAFDFGGRYLRAIGGYGGSAGSFRSLSGVAAAPRGELVTSDRAHARLQRLDAGGRVLGSWPLAVSPGRGAIAVAVDDSGRIAVADEDGGRLWVFDAGGRLLAAATDADGPRALAFAPDGTLLLAEARTGCVSRWTLTRAGAAPGG